MATLVLEGVKKDLHVYACEELEVNYIQVRILVQLQALSVLYLR